ncbi:hypothetical protein LHYA1_G004447 [Lachnellula hyalina]|uniref:Uncharacterized protein n=1 Tax=Lachnellula hyalina TaxID=1316788 RepID=A0A8H8TZZ3_9HELO|nr:uncharacterized protein LHYA1_G004447 [Lachnellula hyalina]TVY26845.1 hypothetical protein LHYA1_G004447 [Lachnellula hyalina]
MEVLQELALQTISLYHFLTPYLTPLTSTLNSAYTHIYPIALPYVNRLLILAHDSPALVSVALLLLFLLLAMRILGAVQRLVVWCFRLILRTAFYGGVVVLGCVVWQRGVERTARDVGAWGKVLAEVWGREYERWEGYQKLQQQQQGQVGGGVGKGSSWR